MAGELIEILDEWDDGEMFRMFRRLRDQDMRECRATRGDCVPGDLFADWRAAWPAMLARGIVYGRGFGGLGPVPLATFGVVPTTPGCGQACLLASADFAAHHTRSLIHLLKRHWEPVVRRDSGLHRIEALSIAGHGQAHRLLTLLGARHMGTRVAMGRHGEDFEEFVWLNEDLIRKRKENA